MKILFWLSLGSLFYTYIGYPLVMAVLACIRPRPVNRQSIHPTVSLVIAAHNEERDIERKLENALSLEYPGDRLEIVVVSDGSTDRTVEIGRRYEARGVRVLPFERRRGKPSLLNDVISRCTGEVVVLSDARQRYDRKALLALVQNFNDPSVGAVSGELHLEDTQGIPVGEGVDFYWRYEKFIRRSESRFDSTVGATGAMYAIRRGLFEPIPADTLLDDVLIPMRTLRRGYRVVFEPEAKAFDRSVETGREEFARKVRTIGGNLQLFIREQWLWNPISNRLWFQAMSHKLLRILGPFLLAVAFVASASLADSSDAHRFVFGAQLLFYTAALSGWALRQVRTIGPWLSIPYAFCLLNVAALVSIVRFLTGHQTVTWQKASELAPEQERARYHRDHKRENPPMDENTPALSPPQPSAPTSLLSVDEQPKADRRGLIGAVQGNGEGWNWQPVLALALLASLVAWLYYPVLRHLAWQWWDDENYSHGFLIPLMSAYFVWERREQLGKLGKAPSLFGLAILAAGVGLLLLGSVAGELYTMRVSLLVVLAGLVHFHLGRRHLTLLAFPILYLLFMIPPPSILFNAIAFPLQLFAAQVATAALQLLDIPIFREGNLITLANTTLEVAEACSGIRSLVTLLALATTLAYFTQRTPWRAGILVATAVPIAILANASRVTGTGVLAQHYGLKAAEGFFHTFSGWFLFLIAAALLGTTGALLSRLPGGQRRTRAPADAPTDGGPDEALAASSPRRVDGWGRLAAATAVLVAGISSLLLLSHGEAVPPRRPLDRFPPELGAWRGVQESLPPPILSVLRVTDYLNRLYMGPGKIPIWLYVGYYETQRQGQIIHSPQQCLPGAGWNFLSRDYLTLRLPGREDPVTINNVLVGKGEERQIVLYWYQERGRVIASEYAAKLYLVGDAVTRNRTDGALVRLSAPVRGSTEQTLEQLLEFLRIGFPNLLEFLPA